MRRRADSVNFCFDPNAPERLRRVSATDLVAAIKSKSRERVDVRNAIVTDAFTCSDLSVTAVLIFESCRFESGVTADRCTFDHTVQFVDCTFVDFNFRQSTAKRGLSFARSRFSTLDTDRSTIDGRLDLQDVTSESISCENIRVNGDVMAYRAAATEIFSFLSASISGKLDLRRITSPVDPDTHGTEAVTSRAAGSSDELLEIDGPDAPVSKPRHLRLKYGQFNVVFLDRANLGPVNAERIMVGRSMYLRFTRVRGTVNLAGATIGGRLSLRGSLMSGEVNVTGVRARKIDIHGGRIGGSLACRGATLETFLIREANLRDVALDRATLGEVTVSESMLDSLSLCDTDVSGSVILSGQDEKPSTIRRLVGSNLHASGSVMLNGLIADEVEFFGVHCETLWLKRAKIKNRFRLRNANVESLTTLAYLRCKWVRIEMSRLRGGLNGRGTYCPALEILSTEIDAQCMFDKAAVRSFGMKDSNAESFVFSSSRLGRAWFNEIRATILSFSEIVKFEDLTIEASIIGKVNVSETPLPCSLTVASSSVDAIDLDRGPASPGRPMWWQRRPVSARYANVMIDLNGTTYKTITCDVENLLLAWKRRERELRRHPGTPAPIPYGRILPPGRAPDPDPDRRHVVSRAHERAVDRHNRFGASLRPAMAVLETALRTGGYDDWADSVYIEFRKMALRSEPWYSGRSIRNALSYVLTGYGMSIFQSGLALSIPVALVVLAATIVPGATTPRPAAAVTTPAGTKRNPAVAPTPIAHPNPGETVDLVLRSYIPGGGDSATVTYTTCSTPTLLCWSSVGAVLRAAGWIFFTIFVATLSGILRYSGRGRGA